MKSWIAFCLGIGYIAMITGFAAEISIRAMAAIFLVLTIPFVLGWAAGVSSKAT